MLVTPDRAADLEAVAAVAESRHRQELMKYEMPYSERIARLELEVEARKMNLESEAAAIGHHVSSVSSASRMRKQAPSGSTGTRSSEPCRESVQE